MKIIDAIKTVFKQENFTKTFILLLVLASVAYMWLFTTIFIQKDFISKPHLIPLLLLTICADLYLSGCYLAIMKNLISNNKFGDWLTTKNNIFLLGTKLQTGFISYGVILGLASIFTGGFVRVCLTTGPCNILAGYIAIITVLIAILLGIRFTSYAITLGLINFIVEKYPNIGMGIYSDVFNTHLIASSILLVILIFGIIIIYPAIIINYLKKDTVSSIYQYQDIVKIIKADTKKYCGLILKLLLLFVLGFSVAIVLAYILSEIFKNINLIVFRMFVPIMIVLSTLVSNVLIADYAKETNNDAVQTNP